MKKKLKAIISFDGSAYFGWQRQSSTDQTIQAKFEQALEKVFKQKITAFGSGRTDARVHAKELHVVFEVPFVIPLEGLVAAINTNLPFDIKCNIVEEVDEKLIATSSAKSRTYHYLFSVKDHFSPFQIRYIAHFKYDLDIEAMKRACQVFIGEHDFNRFHTKGSDPKTTIRTLSRLEIIRVNGDQDSIFPMHYRVEIEGNGFLKQMVRLIVGSLVEVGKGRLDEADIQAALDNPNSGEPIAPVAPAEGLYKAKVTY